MKTRIYPRRSKKQSPIVTDGRITTVLPPGTLRRLLVAFEKDLLRRLCRLPAGFSSCDRAYFRFLFSLIVHAGVAGPDAWKEITSLRFIRLATIGSGRLFIPRKGGEVPVVLPAVTRICAASLGLHLMRSQSPSRHFMAPFPPDGFLIPGRQDLSAAPDAVLLADVQRRFLQWLDVLAAPFHLRITFRQLCDLSRMRLANRGRPVLAGTMLGLHLSNPVPADQYVSVSQLADPSTGWDGRSCTPIRAKKEFHPRPGILKERKGIKTHGGVKIETDWDQATTPLRRIIRSYTRVEKRNARLLRPVVRSKLSRFIGKGSRQLGKPEDESWMQFTTRMSERGSGRKWAQVNAVLLADWIAGQVRSYPPNTVKGRFSDLIQVYKILPGLLCREMTPRIVTSALFGLRISTESLERLSDSLRCYLSHLQHEHGFAMLDIPWWIFRNRRTLREQRIPTGDDVLMLLAQFPGSGPMDGAMRCGILLIRYFGLRLSELCRLRICDVWMAGRPTVLVWDSKGGAERWIETLEIPPGVITHLEKYRTWRAGKSGDNPSARFLVQPNGEPLTCRMFDGRIRKAMRRAGLTTGEGRAPFTIHGLRHTCANGWWLGEVAAFEVARRLGHKSLDTTIPHYIHSQPVKEIGLGDVMSTFEVSKTAMAALYGISRRAVYYRMGKSTIDNNFQAAEFLSILQADCVCPE